VRITSISLLVTLLALGHQAAAQVRVPEPIIPSGPMVPPPPPPIQTINPPLHVPVCTLQCFPSAICQQGQVCPQNCRQVCS
jgi:hypothetical protein